LDLLLDVNNSGQIPADRRIDLRMDPTADADLSLDIDVGAAESAEGRPAKSYKQLLEEVPHSRFAAAADRFPELLADLEAGRDSPADPTSTSGQAQHPPSFLTADDIDNYIYEVDVRLAAKAAALSSKEDTNGETSQPQLLPTLAPRAAQVNGGGLTTGAAVTNGTGGKESGSSSSAAAAGRDLALRNPTSVYNWLRKHAPKTFLQDGEAHQDGAGGDEAGGGGGGGGAHSEGKPSGRGGRGRGERGGRGSLRGKRGGGRRSLASLVAASAEAGTADTDDDATTTTGMEVSTPVSAGGAKGKRKRINEDDPGYRPKGGSSRPAKKKRKSEGGTEATTPTSAAPKKPRKSAAKDKDAAADKKPAAPPREENGKDKMDVDPESPGREAITAASITAKVGGEEADGDKA
jgi:hypothetical protein